MIDRILQGLNSITGLLSVCIVLLIVAIGSFVYTRYMKSIKDAKAIRGNPDVNAFVRVFDTNVGGSTGGRKRLSR